MFNFFKKSNKEYISVDTEKFKNYLKEQGISDEQKILNIIDEFQQNIQTKIKEKSELTYDEFLAEVEEITGRIYNNPANRIELCKHIDEFIENNPEVANSIKLYASYITYGAIHTKLDEYNVNIITEDDKQLKKAEQIIDKFEKKSKIKRYIYMLAKDLVSYGDAFLEKIYDKITNRLMSVAYIPSNKVVILIDDYGEIKKIYQILSDGVIVTDTKNIDYINSLLTEKKIIEFDKSEIVHFNDGTLPGFSDSPLRNLISVWRSFKLIEEALIIHRITRARRLLIFFLDVTGKEPIQVKNLVSKFVRKLTQAFSINLSDNTITSRRSIIKQGSDIVIPITKDSGTKVQSIPADSSVTKIDDLKFYHNRILQNLLTLHIFGDSNISKDRSDYIEKALLRILRTYQRYMAYSLEDLYQELVDSHGLKDVTITVQFPTPDTEEEIKIVDTLIRRIMVINQLVATIGIVPPFEWIVKYVFKDLTQAEIQELISLLKQEKQKQEEGNNEFMSVFQENNTTEQYIDSFKLNEIIKEAEEDDEVIEKYTKVQKYEDKLNALTAINSLLDIGLRYLELRKK